jgi:hypothetical protein
VILKSTITCSSCGTAKPEIMPTDVCLFFYDCTGCGALLRPKLGNCCVFCSYGSVPCPPIQQTVVASKSATPWRSGSIDHEQGVSKAGNPRLITTIVELAWLWLQNQPTSALSLWFHERVRRLGGRMRKTTIVALARKLLVALWRYASAGVVIEGAVMKAAPATI